MLLVTFVIVAIALLSCMVLIPRKLTVTTDEINIHLLAWKINIPADEIEKIEHYPHGIQSSRIAGAGGFFGNLGLFTCKECGKHLSLITDPMDVCIITRKSKMPIVVSIADNTHPLLTSPIFFSLFPILLWFIFQFLILKLF